MKIAVLAFLLTGISAHALEGISEFTAGSNTEVIKMVCGETETKGTSVIKAHDVLNDKIEKLRTQNLLLAVATQSTLTTTQACVMTRQRRSW
jgi:hypothetical protein